MEPRGKIINNYTMSPAFSILLDYSSQVQLDGQVEGHKANANNTRPSAFATFVTSTTMLLADSWIHTLPLAANKTILALSPTLATVLPVT